MIEAICKSVRLSDALEKDMIHLFSSVVKPLDYEYSLNVGSRYCVIAVEIDDFLNYVYCFNKSNKTSNYTYPFVSRYPLCLFNIIETEDKSHFDNVIAGSRIFFQEKFLSYYKNWFEAYVDGEPEIESAIRNFVNKKNG